MVEHNFNSKYQVILCTLSMLLDRFEQDDRLFAAKCIWWLTSNIQFTEILMYYRNNKVFPSDYVKNLVVTPLLKQGTLSPESKISILDIGRSNCQSNPDPSRSLSEQQSDNRSQLNTTCSGKTLKNKNVNYSNSDIRKRFGNQKTQEHSRTRALPKSELWNIEGGYALEVILLIVSERQIYQGNWKREFVQICVNLNYTINRQNITATILINHWD